MICRSETGSKMDIKLLSATIDPMQSEIIQLLFTDSSTDTVELFYPDQYTVAIDDGENLMNLSVEDKMLVYDELKRFAIAELNKPELKPVRATSKTQLLFDAYSVINHGSCNEQQDVLRRLALYFDDKDTSALQRAFEERYPAEEE